MTENPQTRPMKARENTDGRFEERGKRKKHLMPIEGRGKRGRVTETDAHNNLRKKIIHCCTNGKREEKWTMSIKIGGAREVHRERAEIETGWGGGMLNVVWGEGDLWLNWGEATC